MRTYQHKAYMRKRRQRRERMLELFVDILAGLSLPLFLFVALSCLT